MLLALLVMLMSFPVAAAAARVTVTFEANGQGAAASFLSKKVTVGGKYGKLPTAKRRGYSFTGWYTESRGGSRVREDTLVKAEESHKLYAHWKLKTYKITYMLDGGTNSAKNPQKYTVRSRTFVLKNPVREGCKFLGWYRDKTWTRRISKVKKGSVGNLTLYARWEKSPVPDTTGEALYTVSSWKTGKRVDMTFSYSDSFFQKDAYTFVPGLEKASICLASAAYTTGQADAVLANLGFNRIKAVDYDRKASTDRNDFAAFVMGQKTITSGGRKKLLTVVVIRGTNADYEWYSNLNIGTGAAHQGFRKAAARIESFVSRYLEEGNAQSNILWITGHSRGAAVANILEDSFSRHYPSLMREENVYGFNFACPAVSTVRAGTEKNIRNYCNPGDLFTQVPLSAWGYHRYGQDIFLTDQGGAAARFEALTGIPFQGRTNLSKAIEALTNWVPSIEELYKPRMVMTLTGMKEISKYDVLKAYITFLVLDRSSQDTQKAVEIISAASYHTDLQIPPLFIEALFNVEADPGATAAVSGNVWQDLTVALGIAHAHVPEFYYAWLY